MSSKQSFGQRYLSGLFNVGGNVNTGNVNNTVSTDISAQAQGSSTLESLLRTIAELRTELSQLRSTIPPADAEDAEDALADAQAELARTSPDGGMLRRRVAMVADALAEIAPLALLTGRLSADLAEYLASR